MIGEVRNQALKAHQLLLPEPYVRLSPHTALQEPTLTIWGHKLDPLVSIHRIHLDGFSYDTRYKLGFAFDFSSLKTSLKLLRDLLFLRI